MSLTYFLNDLEMIPVAPIITIITLKRAPYIHTVYVDGQNKYLLVFRLQDIEISPLSRVFPEKLTGTQLLKKFPAF